jgi:outer membrane protein assembly factor BamD
MHLKHLLLIAILAFTVGCSSKETLDENLSETEIYEMAMEDLSNNSYTTAITNLRALESRYPFGNYAEQAQLELIYAYYKNIEPEAARAAADRYIRLHPQSEHLDYAYYLKGLAAYDQDTGLLARFLPLEMDKRDPGAARDSYNDFAQLTSRFPDSRYAPDAKQRMIYLRNLLASYEIHVADYYITRRAYIAAANRGRYVVENFQETPSVPDGLAVMTEAYLRLGMEELAATSLAVLKHNYPQHPSLLDGQFVQRLDEKDQQSWLTRATLGLIESDEPLPPGETRASREMQREYEAAKARIPPELQPESRAEFDRNVQEAREDLEMEDEQVHWFDVITFGVFADDTEEVEDVTVSNPNLERDLEIEQELDERTDN